MEKTYCPNCKKLIEGQIISKDETFNVRGEDIKITSSVMVCNECKDEIFNEILDQKNLESAYLEYRKRHDLLSPSKIKGIRENYGLSQRSLANLLEWGEITIHRYESGSLQDEAHDEVLKLISKPENILEIYEKNANLLPPYASKALKKRIDELLKEEIQPNFNKAVEQLLLSERKIDEFTGYIIFDLELIKNIILYILEFQVTFKTKINKLLWYIDFVHFRKYSVSVTGNSYTHSQYGPTPDDYDLIISIMLKSELIGKDEVIAHNEIREQFKPLVTSDKSMFSEDTLETINFVLNKFKGFNCAKISDYSHEEIPYKKTVEGEKISYKLAEELSLKA